MCDTVHGTPKTQTRLSPSRGGGGGGDIVNAPPDLIVTYTKNIIQWPFLAEPLFRNGGDLNTLMPEWLASDHHRAACYNIKIYNERNDNNYNHNDTYNYNHNDIRVKLFFISIFGYVKRTSRGSQV